MERATWYLLEAMMFTGKPHPACPIKSVDHPVLKMEVAMETNLKLLAGCDVASTSTSSVSSAVVDAYRKGMPILSALNRIVSTRVRHVVPIGYYVPAKTW